MDDKNKLNAFTVRVDNDFHKAIRKQCFVEELSKNALAKKALKEYLENHSNDDGNIS